MADHNYTIILAGGGGSRFWPQSRTLEPKQFLPLDKNRVLFEETLRRIRPLIPAKNIFIATSELYRNQIFEFASIFKIPTNNIVFEPSSKNTAPSIGVMMRLIYLRDPEARVCVLPCDHMIRNQKRFRDLLSKALKSCDNKLVVFGIKPHRPATGYGYIKVQKKNISRVEGFVEKPDLKSVKRFIKSGFYFWNSGIFAASAGVFLEEIKTKLPSLYKQLLKVRNPQDISLIWDKVKPISFDYGVLEKSKRLWMFKAQGLGWSDLGSWQAREEVLKKDKDGNILNADIINLGSKNITVLGDNRLIATIGLDNLIIVDTADALLITRKDKSEEVKKVVDILKGKNRQEYYAHKKVKRPWGAYTVLDLGDGFKVKQVEVKPGRALSLQYHKKRSEHWVVVEGAAKIVRNRKSYIFTANESTYIPVGCVHRLCNPSKDALLRIIEVQAGKYLEEDDIVRLKDDSGRK
jgi:mannose-1-phosphate guanylyltransferase/mannose-6-phosphate isomerase